ncbi:NAD(P)-dependent oxidoreductase [Labilibaculum sp. K2S]|uniref:NAD-dependent epimerase/dehydratase family protein n=1 Tax=Labilibaculum sp. K2S TaxID=3056386 RepID=UPI0025A43EEB|nr:NAD(P)-dependent oxidoreductase [Labilibaculum sp. K2S]MDM8160288.1 NAD(P)-dependent oxidoreductase [Labilibaculum sp. K2S]
MRVLLTGVTGFIGQCLMPMLNIQCKDIKILTLNTDIKEAEEKYPYSEYSQCKHVHSSNLEEVVLFNPEITFHLATVTTHRIDTAVIKPIVSANIEFGVMLLDALSKCPAMKLFVNTGSFAEYRHHHDIFDSAYLYAASKTAFRSFVDYYSNLCGFRYITAIPYTVYGGNMTVKRLMDYIKESMDSDTPIDMSGGEQVLDFIHVDDISNFFVGVVVNAEKFYCLKNNGEEFHLGTGIGTKIRSLGKMIENKYQKKCNVNWGGLPYRDRDIMYSVAPIEKNDPSIGWKAKHLLMDKI